MDWIAKVREGMKMINAGCTSQVGNCNKCPMDKYCDAINLVRNETDIDLDLPDMWWE